MNGYKILFLLLLFVPLAHCKKSNDTITICGNRCPDNAPWRVESLDLGLPCFPSREACQQWANANGYSGKPCVKCD